MHSRAVVCGALAASLMMPLHGVRAAMIATDQVASGVSHNPDRELIARTLVRQEVRQQLRALGVDPRSADRRVAALSDAEAAELAANVRAAPAGGFLGTSGVLPFLILIGLALYIYFVVHGR